VRGDFLSMKMKKFILLLLVSLFAAAVLVGCAGDIQKMLEMIAQLKKK